jgi:hypothetical protein
MIAGAGRKFALATSRVCVPAIIEIDSAKMSVSANAFLFISIIFYVSSSRPEVLSQNSLWQQ